MSIRSKDVNKNIKLKEKEKLVDNPKFAKITNYTPSKGFYTNATLHVTYEPLKSGETDSEHYQFYLEHGENIQDTEVIDEISSIVCEEGFITTINFSSTEIPKPEKKSEEEKKTKVKANKKK